MDNQYKFSDARRSAHNNLGFRALNLCVVIHRAFHWKCEVCVIAIVVVILIFSLEALLMDKLVGHLASFFTLSKHLAPDTGAAAI